MFSRGQTYDSSQRNRSTSLLYWCLHTGTSDKKHNGVEGAITKMVQELDLKQVHGLDVLHCLILLGLRRVQVDNWNIIETG